ncbi:unnamed protein product [Gadus morhua 'NCC']
MSTDGVSKWNWIIVSCEHLTTGQEQEALGSIAPPPYPWAALNTSSEEHNPTKETALKVAVVAVVGGSDNLRWQKWSLSGHYGNLSGTAASGRLHTAAYTGANLTCEVQGRVAV